MGAPIVHFEVMGKNAEELQKFYAELFDWKIDANNPMKYGMVDTGSEEGIKGGIAKLPEDFPSYTTVYAQVDDLSKYLEKAAGLGGKTIVPPQEIPEGGAFAMFQDPQGNIFGLYKN